MKDRRKTRANKKLGDLHPGDRVFILPGHPWVGEVGEYQGEESTPVGVMKRIALDNGMNCLAESYQISRAPA